MATLLNIDPCMFGIPSPESQTAPIANLPPDTKRVRWRFRNNDFVRLFVLTAGGLRHFIPRFRNHCWYVSDDMEQGRNRRF